MIEVRGMQELMAQLDKMGRQGEAVKDKALKAGAEIVKKSIETQAPVNKRTNKGKRLKNNIQFEKFDGETYSVGPTKDRYYAHMLEFGTSKMAAQPFMGRAMANVQGKVIREMSNIIKRELGL